MTREEYLENHDINEGAEEPTSVTRCPACGSDDCEAYAVRDGEIVGCDNCLCYVETLSLYSGLVCPSCNTKEPDGIYLRREHGKITEVVGCSCCVREVSVLEWRGK